MMINPSFPTAHFCQSKARFLDTIEYDYDSLTREVRILGLREVHGKTAECVASALPLPRETLKDVHLAGIPTVCRTILSLVRYCWPYMPRDVQVDVTIWLSITNVLNDEICSDPATNTSTLLTDMLARWPPSHPVWKLMVAHLPALLAHFYKLFDQDEPNPVSKIGIFEGITMEQALERLKYQAIHPCVRILELLAAKDAALRPPISGIIKVYVTWHFCELRCRMKEAYDAEAAPDLGLASKRICEYLDLTFSVGWVPLEEWSLSEGHRRRRLYFSGKGTQVYKISANNHIHRFNCGEKEATSVQIREERRRHLTVQSVMLRLIELQYSLGLRILNFSSVRTTL